MSADIKQLLATHGVHCYGSDELMDFEKQMARYFEREYARWRGNKNPPEEYGISTFHGDLVDKATSGRSVDHYNKQLKIYQTFLDEEYLAYSMAYYGDTGSSAGRAENISLEQAQREKYRIITERAGIQDGQHILDIGCGFGGYIKYLLQHYPNVTATGINPSSTQAEYIRNHLQLDDQRFNLIEQRLAEPSVNGLRDDTFDRVLSIGTMEHFSNFDLLFQYQQQLLKPGGKSFHHLIVSADTIPQFLKAEGTLMADYFPGGHIWPYSELMRHDNHLKFVESWFINGMNYWKTIDEWHKRFWNRIDSLYPEILSIGDVESWNRYFVLCKSMFSPDNGKSYGVGHYLFEKR